MHNKSPQLSLSNHRNCSVTLSPQIPELAIPLTTDDCNEISEFVLTNVMTESAVSTCRSHPIREGRDDDDAADRDGREEDDRIMPLSLSLCRTSFGIRQM